MQNHRILASLVLVGATAITSAKAQTYLPAALGTGVPSTQLFDVAAIGAFRVAAGVNIPNGQIGVHLFADAGWADISPPGIGVALSVASTAFAGNVFAGIDTGDVLARDNLGNWTTIGTLTGNVVGLEIAPASSTSIAPGNLVAAHGAGVDEFNGVSWTPVGGGLGGPASSIVFTADGRLLAGGLFPGGSVAQFDGTSWTFLPEPVAGATVNAIDETETGRLVAAVLTTGFGGIFEFDGTAWTQIATTISSGGFIADVVAVPGGYVAVGGMSSIDGITVGNIAKFDGTGWNAVATASQAVSAAEFANDPADPRLVTAGSFLTMNTTPANSVAEFGTTLAGSTTPLGVGCKSMTLTGANMPLVGAIYRSTATRMFNAAVHIMADTSTMTLPFTPIPMSTIFPASDPSCMLNVVPAFIGTIVVTSQTMTLEISIPRTPTLAGTDLFHQTAVILSTTSGLSASSSNGVRATIGMF
ncbi:MAG: hypothetical protein KDE27_25000 [Planctomycetes bacterium]|nr:hypothetical protein [Planctomycetota bacterium]